ncbi:EP1-like glycoprotein 2 [Camellia lanceoleosa]|uniref:EP1-like glycoprotein 2 n=1 Tax=Camellia lanceoleosa TaxID=1840588 RepID=A0ACC0H6N9_9ERIC|nr:EP1-like glycoprotein 2 [Camellia lanceoleosa]
MCYQLVPVQTSTTSRGSYYAELQQGGFLVNFGTSQSMFKVNPINFPSTVSTAYIKLGSDGHLKIFHHSNANGWREIVDMITHDLGECQHPRHCGEYGLCRQGQCNCPIGMDWVRYFEQTQPKWKTSTPDSASNTLYGLL